MNLFQSLYNYLIKIVNIKILSLNFFSKKNQNKNTLISTKPV